MNPVQEIVVRFADCPYQTERLTLGQANMLLVLATGASLCVDGVIAAPPGVTLADVAEAIRILVLRHDSLRTTYRTDDSPVQVLAASGGIPLSVHEVGAVVTERLLQKARIVHWRPFAVLEGELPLRTSVVTANGVVTHVVLAICHVAVDMTSLGILLRELDLLLSGKALGEPGLRPVELQALERLPEGVKRRRAATAYWRKRLDRAGHSLFPNRYPDADGQLYPGLLLRSAGAARALARIASRAKVSKPALVLTALAAVISHFARQPRCPVTVQSSNRFREELVTYVGQLSSDGFLDVDFAQLPSFDTAARRVGSDCLLAYWNARYDADAIWRLFDELTARRGVRAYGREFAFNDLSAIADAAPAHRSSIGERFGLLGTPLRVQGDLSWLDTQPNVSRLTVDLCGVEAELAMALWADPRCLSPDETVSLARAVERVLLAAGDDDFALTELGAITRLAPMGRPDAMSFVDGGWIHPHATRQLLREVLTRLSGSAENALVTLRGDTESTRQIVGYLSNRDGDLTPELVHKAFVAAMPKAAGPMAPHWYVLCRQSPADPNDLAAWQRMTVHLEGDGRAGSAPLPAHD